MFKVGSFQYFSNRLYGFLPHRDKRASALASSRNLKETSSSPFIDNSDGFTHDDRDM